MSKNDAASGNEKSQPGNEKNKPGLRQRLHWATDDRDAEAKALADRAGEDVDEEAARVAVGRAHGEVRDGQETETEDDLATVDDAQVAAEKPVAK
jgi:hypothetical protein